MRAIKILFLAIVLFTFTHRFAVAADNVTSPEAEHQNPFSDYVPFEDEYDIDEDERFMYFGKFFAIGLGTGLQFFDGNMGRLYNTALPVLDIRMLYFFDFRLAGQLNVNSSNHAFTASPSGYVEVNLFRIGLDLKYYLDTKNYGAAVTSMNPYLIGGAGQVYRTQVFQTVNSIQKDHSINFNGGFGMEFVLKPKKTSLGIEARIHSNMFKDRFDQIYLPSGIPNMTGNMYSVITSVLFFF